MKLEWLGHACFLITLKDGTRIVCDPFDESVGYKKPEVYADIVTVSHAHHDHNAVESLSGFGSVIRGEGVYAYENVRISAMSCFHDEAHGAKRGRNLIFKIEAEGKSIVHLGDLGHMPDETQAEFIRNATVLLAPIGGTYTIDTRQAVRLIQSASPVCAVPMHFLTKANSYPITDEKEFAEETSALYLGKTSEDVDQLKGCVIFNYE